MIENGFNAGWRDIGRLALAAIPWALGTGALVWLGFFAAAHDWFRVLSQEKRRAVYVGAEHLPKAKLEIELPSSPAAVIDRVDLDGSTAALYFTALIDLSYPQAHWQLVAPDGTLLESGTWSVRILGGPGQMSAGDKAECVFSGGITGFTGIKTDPRAKSVRFWISG